MVFLLAGVEVSVPDQPRVRAVEEVFARLSREVAVLAEAFKLANVVTLF